MVLPQFSFFAYYISAAYLLGWLFHIIASYIQMIVSWWNQRKMPNRILSVKAMGKIGNNYTFSLILAGILLGILAAFWLTHWFIKEWLIVIIVIMAMFAEEFKVGLDDVLPLEVAIFFNRLLVHHEVDQDLFGALSKVVQELPTGKLQRVARKIILSQRSAIDLEKGMIAFRGIDPLLDEFVLSLQMAGWQSGQVPKLILSRLQIRAGRRWDVTSKLLLFKDRARPYILCGQTAVISSLVIILFFEPITFALAWPDFYIASLLIAFLLSKGLLFCFLTPHKSFRRLLMLLVFLASLGFSTGVIAFHLPAWIGIQTVSHSLDSSLRLR